jgi:hypothetical protein
VAQFYKYLARTLAADRASADAIPRKSQARG